MKLLTHTLLIILLLPSAVYAQQEQNLQNIFDYIEQQYPKYLQQQIAITKIPAPPFAEQKRAQYYQKAFKKLKLKNVSIDSEGNVLGSYRGKSDKILVISAHLDTVFPESMPIQIKREGNIVTGPGIGDDGVGLMSLLALVDIFNNFDYQFEYSILFVGTVGEEGLGNLRGVKHLIDEHKDRKKFMGFISIDGADSKRIVTGALGSKRYRVTLSGRGGHSWGNFGRENPAHVMSEIIATVAAIELSTAPKTIVNIGRVGGGTSVNSIPESTWFEIDIRSLKNQLLTEIEQKLITITNEAIATTNAKIANSTLKADIQKIGDRPSGQTNRKQDLVQAVISANNALGIPLSFKTSSTDANYPIFLGIPAITIGGGGQLYNTHSKDEYFDSTNAYIGIQRLVLALIKYNDLIAQ